MSDFYVHSKTAYHRSEIHPFVKLLIRHMPSGNFFEVEFPGTMDDYLGLDNDNRITIIQDAYKKQLAADYRTGE